MNSLPCKAAAEKNKEAEFLVVARAVVPQLQRVCVARQPPNTHLAENRLSTDFCD